MKTVVTSVLLLALGLATVSAENHTNAHAAKRLGAAKTQIKTYDEEHQFTFDHSVWEDKLISAKQRIERDAKLQEGDNNQRPVFGILTEPLRGNVVAN